ncbi:MAG: thiamine diphosphokinase [Calditrichaeota bacterium]|nr:MAG: thiamine diphosphokinase [Calditrichota bacterium]MBL1208093.1 thiamine diphosphokinase [Calditrichota bacterium]NOG47931.1 thiamine diphosphokinase [Calditrichota bacterium]
MKKIVIIANGEVPDGRFLKNLVKSANYVIAADGGLDICLANNIIPDCLIGDLDSFNSFPISISKSTNILRIPDQNTTDIQKALAHAATLNPQTIEICASFGKRTDHSLGNIIILNSYASDTKLIMHDNYGTFTSLKPGTTRFKNKKGQTVSLFSLVDVSNIHLSGFEFPLDRNNLVPPFLGVSNKICEDEAEIKFDKGKLLIYELNKDRNT